MSGCLVMTDAATVDVARLPLLTLRSSSRRTFTPGGPFTHLRAAQRTHTHLRGVDDCRAWGELADDADSSV